MTTLTERLAAIEQRTRVAIAGPWTLHGKVQLAVVENAALVATSQVLREDIPALVALVRAQAALIAALDRELPDDFNPPLAKAWAAYEAALAAFTGGEP